MARRSKDWNEGLAEDLKDPSFARAFLLAAAEEGIGIQAALGKVIKLMGVREFSKKAKMAEPNILRAVHTKHNPTQETLNRLLKPFGLRLTVAEIIAPTRKRAA